MRWRCAISNPLQLSRLFAAALLAVGSLVLTSHSAHAAPTLEEQRQAFLEAEEALRSGDRDRYWELTHQLRDYPLYPYLRFADLRQRLETTRPEEIEAFIKAFGDSPVSRRLHHAWLRSLAKREKWQMYRRAYSPGHGVRYACYHRIALLRTGNAEQGLGDMDQLWLTGHSLPKACDPVLEAWRDTGALTPALVWQRIRLAMKEGETGLARYLARFLPADERVWVRRWVRLHRNPTRILTTQALHDRHPAVAWIEQDVLYRLARFDPATAADSWKKIQKRFSLTKAERALLQRRVGLSFAYRRDPRALPWLTRVPDQYADPHLRRWRIRAALAQQEWGQVLCAIERLPQSERDEPRWLYWRARALEARGRQGEAARIYRRLANRRGYESFLAADRLNVPYRLEHRPLPVEGKAVTAFQKTPAVLRTRELLHFERNLDARREWYNFTRSLSEQKLYLAAKTAHQWGWHDRAILTLGRSQFRDDLEVRFPVVYEDTVKRHTDALGLDPAWIYAMMRRESAFNVEAHSPRGAAGLMQLMPGTARQTARRIGRRTPRRQELYEADVSIRLGTAHLHRVWQRFQKHPVLATAAYNAGAYRVRDWLPEREPLPADIWIETVPFTETRNYLRYVLAYTVIYEQRLGQPSTRMHQRMPAVPAREEIVAAGDQGNSS